MKYQKLLSVILLLLIVIVIALGIFKRVTAQEGVVGFLEDRFEQLNIPIVDLTIISESPLRLQIIVQSSNQWVTVDDMVMLNNVDREVFIFARQRGYFVESYVRILQDDQGRQLDKLDRSVNIEYISALPMSPSTISDEATRIIATEKINNLANDYDLGDVSTAVEVSSLNGTQLLSVIFKTTSLEEANNAAFFVWSLPNLLLVVDINSQGAQIVLCRAKVINENGDALFDYMYDFQLKTGGWIQDENLIDLSGSPPSEP